MSVEQFQVLAEQIVDSPWLEENQQEEKIIQLADLCRFIASYKPSISIKEVRTHKINVIEDDGIRKGVFCIDAKGLLQMSADFSLFNSFAIEAYKAQTKVAELWMVFIEDGVCSKEDQFSDFLAKSRIAAIYDKVFCLDFFQSKIHALK
ncbi:hypothetical protein [Pedobacter gandavensis]|uniref:hypothetical protein n=1 Tax=Pedobacter gandavensis TaxID=2679963 RepID=UPI002931F634|nr:hypothetical protein [Pedobacter gandavensis]